MTSHPHDQTRGDSTPYIEEGQSASLSRNEVASLCMKAARGAGMSWGLAEEAGYAAAWLVQHGFDGPKQLYSHLEQAQGRQWQDLCPSVQPGEWQAPMGRALCPIALGATLCDYVGLPEGLKVGSSIQIGLLDHPVLLIPFLAAIGASGDMVFDIEWQGGTASLDGTQGALDQAVASLNGLHLPLKLTARSGKILPLNHKPLPDIAAATIAALNVLAMRTTVPSSEASRAGAGSATSDND